MREIHSDGSLVDLGSMLKEQGFEEGVYVRRKSDKMHGMLMEIKGARACIKLNDNGKRAWLSSSALLDGEWVVYTPKAEPEELVDWESCVASSSLLFKAQVTAGEVMKDLFALTQQNEGKLWSDLTFQLKPNKCVVVKNSVAKGKVTLVPSTTKLAVKVAPETLPAGVWQVQLSSPEMAGVQLGLQSAFQLPREAEGEEPSLPGFFAPFWMVTATDAEEQANMKIHWHKTAKGVSIPILKNLVALKPGDRLQFYKPKSAPVSTALEMSPQPAKKRKAAKQA
jgi:hypothetical protein